MLKRMIFPSAIFVGLLFATLQISYAQEMTADELAAVKAQMLTELKDQAALERKAKIEKMVPPKSSGVQSVDNLATGVGVLVVSTNENTKLIPELYKRTLGESVDGNADLTVKKPKLDELVSLAGNITAQIASTNAIIAAIPDASSDISKASPMQAPKATKALNFVKENAPIILPELQSNLNVVNNLIKVVKSSKNY